MAVTLHKTSKPLAWLPFAVGGVVSALVFPVLLLVTAVLLPLGIVSGEDALAYDKMRAFAEHWLGKLILVAVLVPVLWHAAHRARTALVDLGVRDHMWRDTTAVLCYLFAGFFTVVLILPLLTIW